MIKLLAFDLFGTIFRLDEATKESRRAYWEQIQRNLVAWEPFNLSDDWEYLPVHNDARKGLEVLRQNFTVVTFSNAPAKLQIRMLKRAGIDFDGITPLECFRQSKPALTVYPEVGLWGFPLNECGMVTANPDFGDLEGATAAGMTPLWIRGESEIKHLFDLNKYVQKLNSNNVSTT